MSFLDERMKLMDRYGLRCHLGNLFKNTPKGQEDEATPRPKRARKYLGYHRGPRRDFTKGQQT